MRTRRAVAAVLLAQVAATVACGGADDTTADDTTADDTTADDGTGTTAAAGADTESDASSELRDEYVAALVAAAEDDDPTAGEDDLRCMSQSFVDAYGAAEMADGGVTIDDITNSGVGGPGDLGLDFSDDHAADFYDRVAGCMDVRGLMLGGLGDELPVGGVECLDDNISDDLLERIVIAAFTQPEAELEGPEPVTEFMEAAAPCMALSGP